VILRGFEGFGDPFSRTLGNSGRGPGVLTGNLPWLCAEPRAVLLTNVPVSGLGHRFLCGC
jgi:hypothetical protein